MSESTGRDLRRRREALGLSVDDVADATAIPVDYLRALEDGALHLLPPGPYATAYARTCRRYLERFEATAAPRPHDPPTLPSWNDATSGHGERPTGPVPTVDGLDGDLPSDPVVATRPVPDGSPSPRVPLAVVRRLAIVTTSLFFVLVAWQGVQLWRDVQALPDPSAAEPVVVKLQLLRNARLRVEVDGQLVASGLFEGGREVSYTGRDEVSVDVPDLTSARVWLDGRRIAPRGHQDRPRTLTFVRDGRPVVTGAVE
ncbi:MAG: helix-turn-helix domain-containing protein [Alphaproteobacteria bacterium]|nr:helix-turn-helix domain-containing protein [Alphaproteobacteria bacterium]